MLVIVLENGKVILEKSGNFVSAEKWEHDCTCVGCVAGDMEDQVCPVIMVLSSSDSMDDFRTEAVAVSSVTILHYSLL